MKILLTGHDGYVGTLLSRMLRRAGHEVTGWDTRFFEGCGLPEAVLPGSFGAPGEDDGAGRRDVRDTRPADLFGYEAVVHLAALSNDPLGSLNPSLTRAINEVGSMALASAAKAAGVSRFLFASSCSLYGAAGSSHVAEDAPLRPLTPYGKSKIDVEKGLSELADDSFSPTYLRAATAYGVSPRLRGDVVVNNLVGSALTRGEVRLLSDGRSWRPLLHVEDMSRAYLAVLEAPREVVHDEAFNLAPPGENYQIREVAEMVADRVPGSAVSIAEGGGEPDPRSYRVDGGKLLAKLPSFSFRWTVPEGIGQVAEAVADADLEEEDFFGPRFIRLERLQQLLKKGVLDGNLRWSPPGDGRREVTLAEDVGWAGAAGLGG